MSVIMTKGNVSRIQTTKTEGGKSMKKMVKSKKGFSLIELLIVVAILAILAAISINLFGGVLNKQKVKSDKGAASYLQTAVQTYIAETGDANLTKVTKAAAKATFAELVTFLSAKRTIAGLPNGDPDGDYGPYLNQNEIKLSHVNNVLYANIDVANEVVTVVVETKSKPVADGGHNITVNTLNY